MSVFKKAERRGVYLKIAATGPSGSGKTTGAIRVGRGLVGPNGRIALIDTENKSASLYADLDDFDVLDMEAPYEAPKFTEAILAAEAAGYEVLIIDSFSHVWEAVLQYKEQLDRRGGNGYTNWGPAGEKFKDVLNALLRSRMHIIACMRAKTEYVLETNEKGKQVPRKVGLAPVMRGDIEFEFTTVFDLDMSHNAATSKDRTRMFDGRIFQLSTKVGEALAEWLKGAKPEDLTSATSVATGGSVAPAATGVTPPASNPADQASAEAVSQTASATTDKKPITPEQLAKLREYAAMPFGKPLIDRAVDASGEVSLDMFSEDQAAKCITWIQSKMNEAAESGYKPTPPPASTVKAAEKMPAVTGWVAEWFAANDAAVNAYLIKIKWVESGQTWKDLPFEKVEKIAAKPANFARAAGIAVPVGKAAA